MGHKAMQNNQRRRDRRRGSQLVETMLTMLPFLALAFLVMDAAWGLFIRSTLQQAVREGVRYAVTGQVSGALGQVASIEAVVQTQALGLLKSQSATLTVHFLNPSTLADLGTSAGANQGGNIVEVEVSGYQFQPLAPLFRSSASIAFNVTAADVLEGSPGGIPPAI
jgi:Flp pilus assembly protein TadG